MMQKMSEKDRHMLTKSSDRISFLYVDKARIEQTEYGIRIVQGDRYADVPITTINCIILGLGTSITHRAVANIASASCTICWTGEGLREFYAFGCAGTERSKGILRQMQVHENKNMHMDVIHAMYAIRYPSERLKTKSLEALRGIEGRHVKEKYQEMAGKYGVDWHGRTYDAADFEVQDTVNRYLSAANHMLYAVISGIVVTMGYSTAIGFIHTGKMISFVYDIADLYKEDIIIPLAFKLAKSGIYNVENLLSEFRSAIVATDFMKRCVTDIQTVFGQREDAGPEAELLLWDHGKFVKGGKNYSG